MSLGPHGFYWFCVGCREKDGEDLAPADLPRCIVRDPWTDLLKGRGLKALREALEPYLRRHRWFAGKARTLQSINVIDVFEMSSTTDENEPRLMLVSAAYAEGEPDAYLLPLMLIDEDEAEDLLITHPHAGVLRVALPHEHGTRVLCEATWDESFWRNLIAVFSDKRVLTGRNGTLVGVRTSVFLELWHDSILDSPAAVHGGEQSNTSVTFDERLILKLFRRVTPGVNPDFEVGRLLTEHAQLPHAPKVVGELEYRSENGWQSTVAILHEFVPNVGDAWTYTLDELGRYFERVQALEGSGVRGRGIGSDAELTPTDLPLPMLLKDSMELAPPPLAHDTIGGYLHSAELLGRRTAELHVALATTMGDAAFSPEPFTQLYQRGLYQSMRSQARTTLELLRAVGTIG